MKQRVQTLSALLLALTLSLSLSAPAFAAETGQSEAVNEAARAAVKTAMTYGGATQTGWAVWRDGEIIASGQEGGPREDSDAGHLRSLTLALAASNDVYGVGSISKIYTTVAVMQLVEAGKVDLDQPVVKYLPAFKMADPRYKDITVRMLLNHSSGLMGSSLSSGMLFGDASGVATSELLERLSTQRLKADPGAYSVYCNDGFTLAELVVEAVSGMSFEDYLRAHVLTPAGLEKTYFPGEDFEGERVCIYQDEDVKPLPKDCLGIVGAGGLYASAEDAAAFGGALTEETLLKKASLEAMAAPEYARGMWPEEDFPNSMAFGLGWDNVEWYPFEQNGITALVKGGDTQYYHAGLVVLPEYRLSAAVLSAGGVSTYNEMAATQMLIAALREQNVDVAELRLRLPAAEKTSVPKELADASGYYGSMVVYHVDISGDGTLTMRYPATPDLPERKFYYYSDGTFRSEGETSALKIVKGENGQTYLYQWAFNDISGLGYLPASNYAAMKLPENPVSPELQAQWARQMNRAVLPMNERYSSQVYLALGALLEVEPGETENAPGYVGALKIEDETHLRYVVQLPGNAGRDGSDLEMIRKDGSGALWLSQSNGALYMDKAAAPMLSTGKNGSVSCTIQPDGYARWYQVGSAAAGKTMTVQVPENAGFWVYDSKGNVTASSVVWYDKNAKLAEGGMVVFAGDPGAKFELTFQ